MSNLSVIIPVHNEEKDIGQALESLKQQSLKPKEIIIVDDGSVDSTLKIAKRFNVKILKQNHQGPGKARNLGAKHASGNILIFIDADMTFDKDYLKNLVSPIINSREVIGTTHDYEIVLNTKNIWSRCWGKIRVSKEQAKDVKIFRAIRKDKFLELGGFDSRYGYADDQTLWFKYKIKPEVARNSTCYHKNPETLRSVYKQSVWIGASIENVFTLTLILKHILPIILFLIFPIAIPLLAIKRSFSLKELKILIPWMIIFISARYFGTIRGLIRKIYFEINVR